MQISFDIKALTDQIQTLLNNFKNHLDINRLLGDIRAAMIFWIEQLVVSAVEQQHRSQEFLRTLKMTAAKSGLRFNGFIPTSIRLLSGNSISINSPYFAKAKSKRRSGRKSKKRTAGTGCHVGLAYLGLLSRSSTLLVSSAVQSALLCPSFEIAQRTLQSFGIQLDVKTIQRFCEDLGLKAMQNRNDIALTGVDGAFDLLAAYLIKLDAPSAHSEVFCGDGARSYWKRFLLLAQKLGIESHYA